MLTSIIVSIGVLRLGFPRMARWRSHMDAREPSLAQDDILES